MPQWVRAAAEIWQALTRHMRSTVAYLGKHTCSCQETGRLHYKP